MMKQQLQETSDLHLKIASRIEDTVQILTKQGEDKSVLAVFEAYRLMHAEMAVKFARFARGG